MVEADAVEPGFDAASSSVEIVDAAGRPREGAVQEVVVGEPSHLTFRLAAGLPAGTYTVRALTGGVVADGRLVIEPPQTELVPDFFVGGDPAPWTVTAQGVGTAFGPTTEVRIFDVVGQPVGEVVADVVVEGPEMLRFTISPGLASSDHPYTVRTVTGPIVTDSLLFVSATQAEVTPSTVWLPDTAETLRIVLAGEGPDDGEGSDGRQFEPDTTLEVRDERNRTVEVAHSFSVVDPTTAELVLLPGVAEGSYFLRMRSGDQTVRATFHVQIPVVGLDPVEVPVGDAPQPIRGDVTGMTLEPGATAVRLLRSDGTPVAGAVSDVSVELRTRFTFTLQGGLPAGNYAVEVEAGGAVGRGVLVIRAPYLWVLLEDGLDVGYPTQEVGVEGFHTSFAANVTEVQVEDEQGQVVPGAVSGLKVVDHGSLFFTLEAGLPPGGYVVRAVSGDEVATGRFEVSGVEPSVFPDYLRSGSTWSFAALTIPFGVTIRGETVLELVDAEGQVVPGAIRDVDTVVDGYILFEYAPGIPDGRHALQIRGPASTSGSRSRWVPRWSTS